MTAATETRELALDRIVPNPAQPRRYFEAEALETLAESIRAHGVLQPIVVRPNPAGDGTFMIIAGERRFRSAKLAGLPSIPARLLADITDEEAFVLSTLENVAREDMTLSEEARAYAHVLNLGRTVEEVATLFGQTPLKVGFRLSLFARMFSWLVDRGQIQRWLAIQLARLEPDEQGVVLARFQSGELATEEAASRFASALVAQRSQPLLFAEGAVPEEVTKARREVRKHFTVQMDKLARMTSAFVEVLGMDPYALAEALDVDVHKYADIAEEIARLSGKTKVMLANAAAAYDAQDHLRAPKLLL